MSPRIRDPDTSCAEKTLRGNINSGCKKSKYFNMSKQLKRSPVRLIEMIYFLCFTYPVCSILQYQGQRLKLMLEPQSFVEALITNILGNNIQFTMYYILTNTIILYIGQGKSKKKLTLIQLFETYYYSNNLA